jgi:hypothetical protein
VTSGAHLAWPHQPSAARIATYIHTHLHYGRGRYGICGYAYTVLWKRRPSKMAAYRTLPDMVLLYGRGRYGICGYASTVLWKRRPSKTAAYCTLPDMVLLYGRGRYGRCGYAYMVLWSIQDGCLLLHWYYCTEEASVVYVAMHIQCCGKDVRPRRLPTAHYPIWYHCIEVAGIEYVAMHIQCCAKDSCPRSPTDTIPDMILSTQKQCNNQ